jgi:uncharacterized coiled-coil DUF342 family protein
MKEITVRELVDLVNELVEKVDQLKEENAQLKEENKQLKQTLDYLGRPPLHDLVRRRTTRRTTRGIVPS